MKTIKYILLSLFIALTINSCTNKNRNKVEDIQQYNITIFLDLSDRIDPDKYSMYPSMMDRDISAISDIVSFIKEDHKKKGNYRMKDRIRVFMNPIPSGNNIVNITEELDKDYSKMKPTDRNKLYLSIDSIYKNNLRQVYKNIIDMKDYPGSDIWGFFKNNIKDVCISSEANVRNILIILTDGYMYHPASKIRENNRYSYIIPEIIKSNGLINSKWKEIVDKKDFGYINPRKQKDLDNLEIVLVNINNVSQSPYEQDLLQYLWSELFKNMGVKKSKIIMTSDNPEYVSKPLKNFLLD